MSQGIQMGPWVPKGGIKGGPAFLTVHVLIWLPFHSYCHDCGTHIVFASNPVIEGTLTMAEVPFWPRTCFLILYMTYFRVHCHFKPLREIISLNVVRDPTLIFSLLDKHAADWVPKEMSLMGRLQSRCLASLMVEESRAEPIMLLNRKSISLKSLLNPILPVLWLRILSGY